MADQKHPRLILKNIDDDNAGRYRTANVTIAGARHTPPHFLKVPELMEDPVRWHKHEAAALHPVERSARVHADFVKIHPFVGGNGRTARLLMNLELMKAGFPPVVLPVEQRLAYYEALDTAFVEGDYEPFFKLIAAIAEETFQAYWHALGISEP